MPVVADYTAALIGALRTRILAVPGIPTQRAWENVNFTPTNGTSYLEDAWLGGTEQVAEVGTDVPLQRGRFLYQIRLVVPVGTGIHEVFRLADKIADALRASSLTIAGSPHPGRVVSVRKGPRLPEAVNWYSLPISISVDMDF